LLALRVITKKKRAMQIVLRAQNMHTVSLQVHQKQIVCAHLVTLEMTVAHAQHAALVNTRQELDLKHVCIVGHTLQICVAIAS
jgi:hypothetical protein